MRKRGRIDLNHAEIVGALRQVGALVLSLAPMGSGAPDLIVSFAGHLTMLEVKTANGKATDAQCAFRQQGWPVVTVRTVDEALHAVAAHLKRR